MLKRGALMGAVFVFMLGVSAYAQDGGAPIQNPPPQGAPPPRPQGPPPGVPPAAPMCCNVKQAMIRVFLDCNDCDDEYVTTNVTFVDFVRDRASADLHVLVTTQGTGGGGDAWTLKFIGLSRFQGHDHTFTFNTPQTASEDDNRKEFTRIFKIGLVAYAADSSASGQIDVSGAKRATTMTPGAAAAPTKDPWNFWVFRVGTNGSVNGEASSNSKSYRFNGSASRTTEQWKINFSSNGNHNQSNYMISDDETVKSLSDSWNFSSLIVKSLGPKLSFGGRASVSHSSYSNTDRSMNVSPGIEYDFFPYSENTRRSLTVQYTLGVSRYNYKDVTIFDKLDESVPNHSINMSLGLRQPWGSLSASANFSQHLNHTDRYSSSVFAATDVRLFKGFSFNVFGEYSKIKDQIGLRKGGASEQEVLLRLQQLATTYSYNFSFGISYSFGSIFNNTVNPRFGGGGGGMMFFF